MGVLEYKNVREREEKEQQWRKENDDEEAEALSLSDLPIAGRGNCESSGSNGGLASEAEDFEFGSWVEDPLLMCAADEVFFQGQILPLRPSVSSESGLLSGFCPDSKKSGRFGWRSDSMDRSSGNGSWVFSSGNDRSSRSNSTSTYKSHTQPSPKPQMGHQQRRNATKTGRVSSGWGLFRLGLVRTPEIQLQDLTCRKRNINSSRNCNYNKNDSRNSSRSSSSSSGRKSTSSDGNDGFRLLEKKGLQRFFLGGGLNCKCSADAVDTLSSKNLILKSRKSVRINDNDTGEEEEEASLGKKALYHRRTFEWLKELSIPEARPILLR